MWNSILGTFVGSVVSVTVLALCKADGEADRDQNS